ncbi:MULTISPECIES: flagellar filament capping protein FliD [unclassified Clostridium]|uniref:flagellar filament capping protein FliD n=1 Tax=unclassified Clostridium TaxID=2614128 RepID=UPI0013FC08FC|nr:MULTISPECIES: flagellar filament capping protein FliD [unclassified Clostridium]NFR86495.1 flagellar cap protein FliD [Clostridium botulinum]NFR89405.1 flagellar cap protein FliD [Clostridium botulinum]NFT98957.1 flagellar cap protein FliD [Clostridium botulinum]
MRITGMATGLDMDEIIKNSMKPYRIKVDQMTQKKDVVEIKQKLYRDIMSDASKFYDKYFDLTKSDSLLKSSNYKSVIFTSSSDAVKVTAESGAKVGNYKITGNTATASKATVDVTAFTDIEKEGEKYKQITINGKNFDVKADSEKAMAKDLNEQLKNAGVNVSVEYTDFAGDSSGNKTGFVCQSTILGANATFTINGGASTPVATATNGKDATASKIDGFTLSEIKSNGKIIVNGKEISLEIDSTTSDEEAFAKLKEKLSSEGIEVSAEKKSDTDDSLDYGKIVFTSKTLGSLKNEISINVGGTINPDGTVNSGNSGNLIKGEDAKSASLSIEPDKLSNGTYTISGNTIKIEFPKNLDADGKAKYLNELFKNNGIGVTSEVSGGKITLTSNIKGSQSNFELETVGAGGVIASGGKEGDITITNIKTGGVYKTSGQSNTITVDDITFTFNGEIPADGINITGKNDVTETKDKLVNFINDYNTLMEKLNTLTMTKHDKGYAPLTAEQKKEMSESEIKLWNERVEKGQLNKDTDLTRIANSMKETMRTFMNDSGLNLEKIGINPVKDYSGTKNGTFTIDEDKLTKALEENTEDVMNLFIKSAPTKEELDKLSPEDEVKRKNQTGLLIKLKETLYNEFKTSTSSLSKKVGMEGTSTFTNNTLTKSMSDYEKKIKDMEKSFSRREQALYSKYATLEKMMNKLNSQQSNLMSQLGMS